MKPVEIEFLMKDRLSGGIDDARMKAELLDASLKKVALTIGSVFTVGRAIEFGKTMIKVRSEIQNTEASFKVFLGDAEKAADFMKELKSYAFNNVFELKDLSQQSAQLLAYGNDAKNVIPILDKLSNVAAGVNQPLERFVELYNKAKSRDKLDLIDVQQWSVMGDMVGYLSDMLGKSKSEVRDMISAGQIGFKELDALLNKLTESGGTFNGMMKEKMKTLGDSVGLLQDSITSMFNELGEKAEDFLRGGILTANTLVENYEKVGKVIVGLIATYGTYKAAVMTVTAVEKVQAIARLSHIKGMTTMGLVTDMLKAKTAALNKTMLANPYVLVATAVVALGVALWALHDSTTAEEKAHKKLNDTLEETRQKKEDLKSKTNELISIIKDETQTIYAQAKAWKELKKEMPEVFGKMTLDEFKKLSIEEINAKINIVLDEQDIRNLDKQIEEQALKVQKEYDKANKVITSDFDKTVWIKYNKEFAYLEVLKKKRKEIKDTRIEAEFDAKPIQEKIAYYNQEIDKLDTQKRQLDTILLGNKEITGEWGQINFETLRNINQLQTVNDKLNEMKGKLSALQTLPSNANYGELYDNAKKGWESTKKTLGEITKDRKKYTKEQYDAAVLAEATAKKTYEGLGGVTTKKTTGGGLTAAEKANQLKAEQSARKRQIEEYTASLVSQQKQSEFDIEQARIDTLKSGYEKEMAAIDLNFKKMFEEDRLRREKWVKDLQASKNLEFENENPDWKKKGLELPVVTENDLTQEQKDQLKQYVDAAIAYKSAAEDKLLKDTLKQYEDFSARYLEIQKKYQEEIALLEKNNASQESIDLANQAYLDANTALDEEFAQKEETFQNLMARIGYMSLQQLEKTLKDAENALKQSNINDGQDSKQSATLRAKIKKLQQEIKAVKAEQEIKDSDPVERWKRTSKAIKDCKREIDGMISSMDFLDESTKSALQAASNIADGAIAMIDGIQMLAISAGQSISAVEKASVILAIIGAAVQIITAIFNTASAAEEKHQKALKEIASEKLAFQREYNLLLIQQNELLREAETIFGVDAYGKAKGLIDQMKNALSGLEIALKGDDPSKNYIKKMFDPSGYQKDIENYKKGIQGLADIEVKTGHKKTGLFGWGKGKDIYSSVLDVYPDLIDANGKFNASLAETIIKTRTLSDEDKAALQNMIDLSNLMEEAFQAVKDYLSDIFGELGGNISDALVDAFRNGTDAAKKFTESVTGMLEKLAEQMIYSVTIAPYLAKAQEDMLNIMQNENLTDEQKFSNYVGILDGMMDGILAQQGTYNSLLEQYKKMAEDRGFNLWEPDSKTQSGKAGAYEAASQESITRLEGLYSSMLEHSISIDGSVENIVEGMSIALGHLRKIEENTGSSNEHLDKIEKAISTMKDDVATIKRDGIKTR